MEMMLLRSFAEWQRNGYTPEVLATAAAVGPLAPELRAAGYRVHHLPLRGSVRYLPGGTFLKRFFELCGQFDVVHIHTEAAAPLYALVARAAGVRQIALTKHNVFAFNGVLRMRKVLERWFIRTLGGRYGMISEAVQQCEQTRFHNTGPRVINWMDTEHFRPPTHEERAEARRALQIADGSFVVLSVGNCSRIKNHDAILHALHTLKDEPVCYLHLGKEQPDQPERLLAGTLQIAQKVRFAGSVADTRTYYWAGDAYLMPSLHEGFSIAALEAIATGLPAVLGHVAGLSDLAADTQHVLFVKPDAADVAEAIRTLRATAPEVRTERSLADSDAVRGRYAVANGVRCTVEKLYEGDAGGDL